jgi:putative FmdB family regulatory protein
MPTYQYSCSKCGEDLEVYQSFSEAPLKRHQGCGGSLQKVFAPVGIVLKGSGFYKTDSRSGTKSRSSSGKSDSGGETKTETAASSSSGNGSAKETGAKSGSDTSSGQSSGKGSDKPAKPAKQSA